MLVAKGAVNLGSSFAKPKYFSFHFILSFWKTIFAMSQKLTSLEFASL
jgi:hypothetical protein